METLVPGSSETRDRPAEELNSPSLLDRDDILGQCYFIHRSSYPAHKMLTSGQYHKYVRWITGSTNEALLEEVKSGLYLSLEYATDKSCSRPNKLKQTTDAAKGGMMQL